MWDKTTFYRPSKETKLRMLWLWKFCLCLHPFSVNWLVFVSVNAGISSATLLHSKSLRGHRDCFEKCHLIANQKLSRSKVSRSAYEGMKLALSQKLNRIIQYAQNKDSVSSNGPGRRGTKLLCLSQQSDCKLLPQSDAQVPRYAPRWDTCKAAGLPDYTMGMAEELGLLQESQSDVWTSDGRKGLHSRKPSSGGQMQHRHQGHSRDECEHSYISLQCVCVQLKQEFKCYNYFSAEESPIQTAHHPPLFCLNLFVILWEFKNLQAFLCLLSADKTGTGAETHFQPLWPSSSLCWSLRREVNFL